MTFTAANLHPALSTRATELFGVQYPIVQTGMGYVSDAGLTAATANAGGLGIIAAGMLSYDELAKAITTCRSTPTSPSASTCARIRPM